MISFEECRKLLGDAAHGLSDDELDHLRQRMYALADIALACALARKDKDVDLPSKEPSG